MDLARKDCLPCRGDMPPLPAAERDALAARVPAWAVVDGHHLERSFTFPDFRQALDFVNAVGDEAEAQGHHPDLGLSWGRVDVTLFTHAIDGLSEADFIMAARIDRLRDG